MKRVSHLRLGLFLWSVDEWLRKGVSAEEAQLLSMMAPRDSTVHC